MMEYELVIAARASEDILRNAEWWAENHSTEQSVLWFDSVFSQLEKLRLMPERFPIASESGLMTIEIREMPLGVGSRPSYRAIFTIKQSSVHVLTVRRASQDMLTTEDIE